MTKVTRYRNALLAIARSAARAPSTSGSVRMGRTVAGADGLNGARAARLLGYFLVSFGTLGMQYAFGPIYAELLKQLQGSREVVTLSPPAPHTTHTHTYTHAHTHTHTYTHYNS